MSDAVISTRGTARLEVDPDAAILGVTVTARAGAASAATTTLRTRVDNVCSGLDELGGSATRSEAPRERLSYIRAGLNTREERAWNESRRSWEPTGQFAATMNLRVIGREFGELERITSALVSAGAAIDGVRWTVDSDNSGWRSVRRAAVTDAIEQARDYAAALGGNLTALEHLADAGLLGSDRPQSFSADAALAGAPRGRVAEDVQVPELTPVPQALYATVEARFQVVGITLPLIGPDAPDHAPAPTA